MALCEEWRHLVYPLLRSHGRQPMKMFLDARDAGAATQLTNTTRREDKTIPILPGELERLIIYKLLILIEQTKTFSYEQEL